MEDRGIEFSGLKPILEMSEEEIDGYFDFVGSLLKQGIRVELGHLNCALCGYPLGAVCDIQMHNPQLKGTPGQPGLFLHLCDDCQKKYGKSIEDILFGGKR